MANTNDFTRRGEVIDAVYERIKQIGYENNVDVLSIGQAVRDVPSADVRENVHGEWIDDYDPVNFGEFRVGYKCSKCGARTVERADNFCYQCGADMRGEEDD